ncbi:MAG: hypothetical protein KC478_05550, partial [Bacteriovoracaceae bacterium]|nr:hypothetical protein [Bacteriovoracaceae bacterium]
MKVNLSESSSAKIVLLIIFCACLYAFYTETFLTWDASYQLFTILETKDFHTLVNRKMMGFFQLPVLFYIKYFNDVSIGTAKFLYGIIYSFVPFIVTTLCYIFSKNKNSFFLLSICATLPFSMMQLHYLSEHLIACQVYCLMLLTLRPVQSGNKLAITVSLGLAFFLTWLHPISIYLLALHGALSMFMNWKSGKSNKLIKLYSIGLFIVALLRFYSMLSFSYSREVLSDGFIFRGLTWGHDLTVRIPIRDAGLLLVLMFCLFPIIFKLRDKKFIPHIALILGAVGYISWYQSFIHAPNYMLNTRFLIFVIATPFYLLYFWEFVLGKGVQSFAKIALTSSIVYALFVSVVSYDYKDDLTKLDTFL